MYKRALGNKEDGNIEGAAQTAERIRAVLTRAVVLLTILTFAPILYGMLTGGSLDSLVGASVGVWETIQWSLFLVTIFFIIGLIAVARVHQPGGRRDV